MPLPDSFSLCLVISFKKARLWKKVFFRHIGYDYSEGLIQGWGIAVEGSKFYDASLVSQLEHIFGAFVKR